MTLSERIAARRSARGHVHPHPRRRALRQAEPDVAWGLSGMAAALGWLIAGLVIFVVAALGLFVGLTWLASVIRALPEVVR